MNTKATYLDPKRVLVETPQGDKFIIGFHSEMNYQLEQQGNIPFTEFLESVFSFQRDPVHNRIIMGDRIRKLREQKGMDIMELAFKSNIQPNTLKRIEAGKFSADLDILTQIALGMGMKIDFVETQNDESHESISDVRP